PPVREISEALIRASRDAPRRSVRSLIGTLPAVGAALLPKVACPACWPAYAGFLSAVGLGFLLKEAWLLPLTATFLAMAVGALAFQARRRRRFGPLVLGGI